MSPIELNLVTSAADIHSSLDVFNQGAQQNAELARDMVRKTTYWVYDETGARFGPGKFVGFRDIDFATYAQGRSGQTVGDSFDGTSTRRAIAAALGGEFQTDPALASRLQDWAERLLGSGILDGIDKTKWVFVSYRLAGRRYWKISPGEQAKLWERFRREKIISIGWGKAGDLSAFTSREDLATQLRSAYGYSKEEARANATTVWTFAKEVKLGDIVVANAGQDKIVGRGEVIGAYSFDPKQAEYRNVLRIRWFDTQERSIPEQRSWLRTIMEIPARQYHELFGMHEPSGPPDVYQFLRDRDLRLPSELVTTYLLSLKTKPLVILSGISGTGKTKLAQAVAEWAGSEEFTEEEEGPAAAPPQDAWVYQLQPYNFSRRKVIVARESEALFELPSEGSVPVQLQFEGKTYQGSIGTFTSVGRRMHELRFGVPLARQFAERFAVGDYAVFSASEAEGDGTMGLIRISKVEKRRVRRLRTIYRHEFIAVRPDWLDGKEVLGFYNALTEQYSDRPFLRLLLRAHRDPGRPYFAIFDEMNLARPEHYFADVLSTMESRTLDGPVLRQEPVHLHDERQCLPLRPPEGWERPTACAGCRATPEEVDRCTLHFNEVQMVPPRLKLPANVYLTGTVNIDETTHMFSPKVLDRTNVIEFNDVQLLDDQAPAVASGYQLNGGRIELGMARPAQLHDLKSLPRELREALARLHGILAQANLHFGYRVANEIARYILNAIEYVGAQAAPTALDFQVLQKVLPKLHGSRQRLLEPLTGLLWFAAFQEEPPAQADLDIERLRALTLSLDKGGPVHHPTGGSRAPWLPRSARKLGRMLHTLRGQGFVSFIE